jgi:hypothetical protein
MERLHHRRPVLLIVGGVLCVAGLVAPGAAGALAAPKGAPASTQFTCVVQNVNTCIVTIPLSSNMDEQVGSTMPDSHPWYFHIGGGTEGDGGYTLSGPGAPQTYWNGVSGATQGTVWSALLTTDTITGTDPVATLTFAHVTAITPSHYKTFTVSWPSTVKTGAVATITAVVRPIPPKGHLLVQRQNGTKWVNVVSCAYSARKWTGKFRWTFPKHTTKVFRLLATAAPELLQTPSTTFRISTAT